MPENVIYTVITGDYDTPLVPCKPVNGFERVLVTDSPFGGDKPFRWFDRLVEIGKSYDSQRTQRKNKILFQDLFPDAGTVIYVDGNIVLSRPVHGLTRLLGDSDIALPTHPSRHCVYAEIKACRKLAKDSKGNLDKARKELEIKGVGHGEGVWATGVIVRRNNEATHRLMEDWWQLVDSTTLRDQITLPLAIKESEAKVKTLPGFRELGVSLRPHFNRRRTNASP